ncbi:Xaa-Pro dipeptidyl-peptidase [Leuconostoc mesenteroides]|uniref:Xaa-Pro dipeptidyl-peptidase n=1 Tax=Leuconostoc mesenteroides TaxID=1245 RepID=UPI00235E6BDC|nr:Xaa-Pro dipeptidyl-peptidase [Leuconostoc mesenteroides]
MINQYGRIAVDSATELQELRAVGFNSEDFETLLRRALTNYKTYEAQNDWLREHLATDEQNIFLFLETKQPLTQAVFYCIAAQLLGFTEALAGNGYNGVATFRQLGLPIVTVNNLRHAWYELLNSHTNNGLLFIDELASQGYFESNNHRLLFNGKSLPTYNTNDLIRESVWVETSVDTDNDGRFDLVQVDIIRPNTNEKLPVLFTASPYYQGLNERGNDAKVHDVNVPLTRKDTHQSALSNLNQMEETVAKPLARQINGYAEEASVIFTQESGKPVDLNQYFLSRGYAVVYAAGIGTRHSDGMQDTGSPEQVESMKNVVEWLAGNRVAFTDRTSNIAIVANWSNHNIAMTGRSYLGTLATAVATTGVSGLKTVISEAAISNWYQYYRDNGLVVAPGGFPGEDMDVLAELVYSRIKDPADWLKTKNQWDDFQANTEKFTDRVNGNYDYYWDTRNYLNQVKNIKVDMIMVHGLNDWNVKPRQVYQLWSALRDLPNVKKIYLHQGQHIYINNNRSLDFSDQMNLWLTEKLLDKDVKANEILPTVIWKDNTTEDAWHVLDEWGASKKGKYYIGNNVLTTNQNSGELNFKDWLPENQFAYYCEHFDKWRDDTITGKLSTNQIFKSETYTSERTVDGEILLNLRVKSSQNIGLISAMVVDYGNDTYLKETPTNQGVVIDRGVNFSTTDLVSFESEKSAYKMITIGYINLQNRTSPRQNDDLWPNQYVDLHFELQPTYYKMRPGHQLGLIIYATDFEMTIRGNQSIAYTIDLSKSSLDVPFTCKK